MLGDVVRLLNDAQAVSDIPARLQALTDAKVPPVPRSLGPPIDPTSRSPVPGPPSPTCMMKRPPKCGHQNVFVVPGITMLRDCVVDRERCEMRGMYIG